MGHSNSTCCVRKSKTNERVLMLGLDDAGKSKSLYYMKLNQEIKTLPTLGFNVEQIELDRTNVIIWEVGGHKKSRAQWHHYYSNTIGLIYVVDSSDTLRMEESCKEFLAVIQHPEMQGVPVLILANKQDMSSAISTAAISDYFMLDTTLKDRNWFILSVSSVSGFGFTEALTLLNALVTEFRKRKSSRRKREELTEMKQS
ncbi:ADP-ribosylation factor-like [Octopus vulgaris]|uniref:ADP-ribosylation factor-like n=2 Tax=Octopus TaxID=6643 RepID=A0AA36FCG0_OCTVU|nr:ADP-ribosylation factor 1-like [Octopus sinensis]CAI9729713.1 ADP-ribosylation factor-like [Octopus vulgaris]